MSLPTWLNYPEIQRNVLTSISIIKMFLLLSLLKMSEFTDMDF